MELPPGDVCPREKTSEEPSGDVCPRGGNPRDGRSGVFIERTISRAKLVKSLKDSSCIFDWLSVFLANRKFVEGAPCTITQTPVKNFLESC